MGLVGQEDVVVRRQDQERADDRDEREPGDECRRAREELSQRIPRDMPPSTMTVVPLTYAALAEARKHTTSPNSRGVPSRPTGICAISSDGGPSSPYTSVIRGVSIRPGATQFTVTPLGPTSRESVFSQPTSPGRIAFDSARCAVGSFAVRDVI